MEYTYGECRKTHGHIDGKLDGCQKFQERWDDPNACDICRCHRNFHRTILPPVKYVAKIVYTKCHKIHDFKFQSGVDGCQEFIPAGNEGMTMALYCAVCDCHKGFHRNEIREEVIS